MSQPNHATCQTPPATHAEKVRANGLVNMRQRRGALAQPTCCTQCGIEKKKLDKHHEDYSKPEQVEWLCRSCHMKRHWSDRPNQPTVTQ